MEIGSVHAGYFTYGFLFSGWKAVILSFDSPLGYVVYFLWLSLGPCVSIKSNIQDVVLQEVNFLIWVTYSGWD